MDPFLLAVVLAEHQLWLDTEGRRGARADLTGARLCNADLTGADLTGADLIGVQLSAQQKAQICNS